MYKKINLQKYKIIIFDCDGVLLNSNPIKTQAFFEVAKVYGISKAEKLRDYHIQNSGVSRIKKFEYFLEKILNKPYNKKEIEDLLDHFAKEVKEKLFTCELDESLLALKQATSNIPWVIVSGGNQSELREVFAHRGIDSFFDKGIFGNPASKVDIISNEKLSAKEDYPILFIGDSKYDFEVSQKFHMDFIFVSHWTDLPNWFTFITREKINSISCLADLLDYNN